MAAVAGLDYDRSLSEQVLELVDRVEDYLCGWHLERGRRREMELFDGVYSGVRLSWAVC